MLHVICFTLPMLIVDFFLLNTTNSILVKNESSYKKNDHINIINLTFATCINSEYILNVNNGSGS
jgi:hypothetical protein